MELECAISKSQEEILSRIIGFYEECEVQDDPGKKLECSPSSRREDVEFGDEEPGTTCDMNERPVSFGNEDSEQGPVFNTQSPSLSPAKKKRQSSTNSFDGAFESDRSHSPSPVACFDPNVGFATLLRSPGLETGAAGFQATSGRSLGVDDETEAGTSSEQVVKENGRAPEDDECIKLGRSQADEEEMRAEKQSQSEETKKDTKQQAEETGNITREKELGGDDEESITVDNNNHNEELVPESVKGSSLVREEEADREQKQRQEEIDLDPQEHKDDEREQQERDIAFHHKRQEPEKEFDREQQERQKEVDRGEQEHENEGEQDQHEREKVAQDQQECEHKVELEVAEKQISTERRHEEVELTNDGSSEDREDERDSECLEFSESHLMFQTQLSASPNATFPTSFGCTSMSPTKENCIVITPLGERITHSHSSIHDDGSTLKLIDNGCETPRSVAEGIHPDGSTSVTRRPESTPVQDENAHPQVLSESTSKRKASSPRTTPRVPRNLTSTLNAEVTEVPQTMAAEQNIGCQPESTSTKSTKTPSKTGSFGAQTPEQYDEAKLSDPRSVPATEIVSMLLSAGKRLRFKDSADDPAKRPKLNQTHRSSGAEINTEELDTTNKKKKRKKDVSTAEEVISSFTTPVNRVEDFGVAEFSAALTKIGYKLPPFTC